MKILFLTNTLNMGGIETNLVRLTSGFVSRGHDVVAATGGGALEDALSGAGGRHHHIQMSLAPSRFPPGVRRLAEIIDVENPDIVHAFSAPAALTSAAANRWQSLRRKRAVATLSSVMGLNSSAEEPNWLTHTRAWLTCVGMDKVAVISPAIAEVLEKTPVPEARLVPLPVVGVEAPVYPTPSEIREVRRQVGVESRLMVLTVGNLEPRKSHHLFVSAAVSLAGKRDDVSFFIAGEGAKRPELEQQIRNSGYAQRITLLGERHDAQRLIASTDVYVKPGVVEGFIGITVLEAQARGVPVVAFETEDVKLAIEDGVTGRLVPRGDVAALADSINDLLNQRTARQELGEAGCNHVTQRFSIGSVVAGLEGLYGSLITSNNVRGSA